MGFLTQWCLAGYHCLTAHKRIQDNLPGATEEERIHLMATYVKTTDLTDMIQSSLAVIRNPFGGLEWQALARLFQRPYWKRVWVIQEITLAAQVTLRCGQASCGYGWFFPMALLMNHCDQRNIWAHYGPIDLQTFTMHKSIVIVAVQPTMLVPRGRGIERQNVMRLLRTTASAQATDPRDKVYALLSLVPPEKMLMKLDYSKTVAKVYTDFALSEIQVSGSLGPIYMLPDILPRTRPGLPTWVPDLASDTAHLTQGLTKYMDGDFRAAGTSKPLHRVSRNRTTLEVCGVQQCIIDEVDTGAVLDGAPSYPERVAEVLPRWLALA
ncbi:hypothetical protein GE09DRAFT_632737 [Coniochaeta sp. 2T2.1]|nr:hypothetical protein GE09DRAFT_632737 [Coniochaeta sp. 2T2.1]